VLDDEGDTVQVGEAENETDAGADAEPVAEVEDEALALGPVDMDPESEGDGNGVKDPKALVVGESDALCDGPDEDDGSIDGELVSVADADGTDPAAPEADADSVAIGVGEPGAAAPDGEGDALVVPEVEPGSDGDCSADPEALVDCEPDAVCVGAGNTDGSAD